MNLGLGHVCLRSADATRGAKIVAMYWQENCPLEYFTICNKTVAAIT